MFKSHVCYVGNLVDMKIRILSFFNMGRQYSSQGIIGPKGLRILTIIQA